MYETRTYDKPAGDGFAPDPVVVLVATGTHDVSRLVALLNGGQPVVEQCALGRQVRGQLNRHNSGREALKLLRAHGGPDLLTPVPDDTAQSGAGK